MSQAAARAEAPATTTITGTLHRHRTPAGHTFEAEPPDPPPDPVRRPARVAAMLSLAHKIQDAIDRGVVTSQAEAAQRLGVTLARVTQLLNLTLLSPDIQEAVLELEAVNAVEPLRERALRALALVADWGVQRGRWGEVASEQQPAGYPVSSPAPSVTLK